jgi:AraC-like DNA-binding protein
MLTSSPLLVTPDLLVRDLQCAHPRSGWGGVELARRAALVFPRRGSFRRRGLHGEEVVEPGVAYFQRPGEEEEFAHPHDGGDRCTCVAVSETVLASLLGGDPTLPAHVVPTTPAQDLALRSPFHEEGVIAVVGAVLAAAVPRRVAAGRPATAQARKRVADDAREALAFDPSLGLVDLARLVAVSPHHLSRVFRAEVGVSVSGYRRRLRLRAALERLGEADLARVAADAGYADHAHFAREARALLGATPSALQREIAGAPDEPR